MQLTRPAPRFVSWLLVASLTFPTLALTAGCGNKAADNSAPMSTSPMSSAPPQKTGMSTKQKVVLLAGAALLYYLYKKHQSAQNAQTTASGAKQGQLYRSKNGGVYYRNAQGAPVWVTAPAQGVSVPLDQVQRYAPDYQQYQGQAAPPIPQGQQAMPADQYDPSLSGI